MTCLNGPCGKPGRPYRYALGHRTTVLCPECATALVGYGLDAVERRVADLPVLKERRHFSPPWLARLRGRDETGRIAA